MNTRRSLVLWATTLALAFVASALPVNGAGAAPPDPTPPTPPAGVEEVQSWALSPAGSEDPNQGGNRSDLSYLSAPGAVIEDAVTLSNFGNTTQTFRVYATDAFNNAEGKFDLLAGDATPTDVGSWVTFPQEMITVPAGKQVTMPITIKIPADATSGDHTGAVLASSPTVGVGGQGEVVTLDRRTGTRIYLRVSGPLFPELAVADVETTYHHALNPLSGSAQVTYRVENRGNVRLSGTASVTVSGPFGIGEQKMKLPDIAELLPGQKIIVTVDVPDVAAGLVDFTTVRLVPVAGADLGAVKASSGEDLTFAPPMALLVAQLLLLFGLLLRRARMRRNAVDWEASLALEVEQESARIPEHQPT